MKIHVIGAGIGGLAVAIRQAIAGQEVHLWEKNSFTGGKLAEFVNGPYRFDAGPSLFTLPELVTELFELAGKDSEAYFSYKPTSASCHYFYEDGTNITGYVDNDAFAKEVEEKLDVPAQRVHDYLNDAGKLYDATEGIFLNRSLHQLKSYFSADILRILGSLHKLNLGKTMHQVNQKRLQHPKLVQLFDRFGTYAGSDPYRAPAVLNMIPHLEHNLGTYFPTKGMYSITKSLEQLALDLGVNIHLNSGVERILHDGKKVCGVQVDGVEHLGDCVISNADVTPTYRRLLPDLSAPEMNLKQEASSSALIFYWGIDRSFDKLGLHNILFSERYKEEFDQLFDGKIIDDPTVYVFISSKHCPDDAPEGHENWFTMINVPSNTGQDWEALIQTARKNMIEKINRMLDCDIEAHIVCEQQLDPISIESRTASHEGALYGSSSNKTLSAFLRHPNFSGKLKGLYFCGGSVHPGGGIPLCLLSAKIVSDMLD